MNNISLIFIALLLVGCGELQVTDNTHSVDEEKFKILPLKIKIIGQLNEIEDVGLLTPSVIFDIRDSIIDIQIGASEYYELYGQENILSYIFDMFEEEDFKSNEYFYNPYFDYMGYMEVEKEVDDTTYLRKFSSYKRRDIKVDYLELDSAEVVKFAVLSDYLNKIVIGILKDNVIRDTMIVARSFREALAQPDKVYELKLRNTRSRSLKRIGELKNLRVLDISGSWITEIPDEIQNCKYLRSIIANASRLEKISPAIGQLRELRNANFGYCNLRSIPRELGEVESLWSLGLGGNQLNDLPESISNLKNVMFFSIDKNRFTEFPNEVLGLESVVNLWMHGNDFKTASVELNNLPRMSHLLIDAHEIENINELKQSMLDVRIIDEERRK
ncbi:leucine-rich repeat domain-containing protein [Lewinella cohaerens]|uniref:leucine-rich repeat domain-containing protein n=1 Tax=Lewinella cohaerens TaxID=70995 RepID=UPI00037EB388|nr:leucine-rich repeat domain-containing protein [Lewinella cohaerens]